MSYDSTQDTRDHIGKVAGYLSIMADYLALFSERLKQRGTAHDASKLQTPEKEIFDEATPRLKALRYGDPEYMLALAQIRPALNHHYAANSHHPEHYPGGINDMNLMDVIEMFCDWKAASERHTTGSMEESLSVNIDRFYIEPQLVHILKNTAKDLGWIE